MAQQETAMQGAMSAAKSKAGATPRAAAAPARLSDATIVELMADAAEDTDRDNGERLTNHFRGLGIDAFVLSIALWGARGDEALIRKLIVEHKQGRSTQDCSRSSAVERPPDTRDVAGSIPADCTSSARVPGTR